MLPCMPYDWILARSPLVGTESNAFAKSKYATSIWSPSSIALVQIITVRVVIISIVTVHVVIVSIVNVHVVIVSIVTVLVS